MTIFDTLDSSWREVLASEFSSDYISKLSDSLEQEYNREIVYPSRENLFRAMQLCRFDDVKVVILGQDPYHQPEQAQGLSFSVDNGVKIPKSLQNIFKEIEQDLGIVRPTSGSLTSWAEQGVLLINAIFTVRYDKPGSHSKLGWMQFTDAIIREISARHSAVVFILWGNFAKEKAALIDQSKHLVLTSVHPSPLSASRGFFGNRHFSRCNEFLEANSRGAIDWSLPTEEGGLGLLF